MVRIPFKIHLIRFSICQDLRFSVVNNIMNVYVRGVWYRVRPPPPITTVRGSCVRACVCAFTPNGNEWFLSSLIIQSGVPHHLLAQHPRNVYGKTKLCLSTSLAISLSLVFAINSNQRLRIPCINYARKLNHP